MTDPLNQTWVYTSDKIGRPTGLTSPVARQWSYTYDAMGRLLSTTDPLGGVTSTTYDSRGLVTAQALPGGISASYSRDAMGQVTGVTDPNGNSWTLAYDAGGRLTSRTDPLANTATYAHDTRGRVATVTYPQSAGTLTFSYDGAGQVLAQDYSDGTALSYTYDHNGKLLTSTNLALAYNARGELINSNGLAVARDLVGRVQSVTLATDKSVTYTYNARGLVSTVTDWLGGESTLAYDDAGRLATLTRPNGISTSYTYDLDGRLVSIFEDTLSAQLAHTTLTRDGGGQVTAAQRNVPQAPDFTDETQSFSYDAAHQLSGATHDALGRVADDGARTYTWNLASLLTSYTEGSDTTSFTHDGLGLRVSRTSGGVTRQYTLNYALGRPSISVEAEGGSDLTYYVHLPNGALLYSVDAADDTRRFYHYDEVGTTLFLSDDSGAITDTYGVTPYGEVVSRTGTSHNPFIYMGAHGVMAEGGTGLYYMRARYYDSRTGRFVSRDPALSFEPRRLNPYPFALGNPLLYIDPSGAQEGTAPDWANKNGGFGVGGNTSLGGSNGINIRTYVTPLFGIQSTLGMQFTSRHVENDEMKVTSSSNFFHVGLYGPYKLAYWQRGSLSVIFGGDIQSFSISSAPGNTNQCFPRGDVADPMAVTVLPAARLWGGPAEVLLLDNDFSGAQNLIVGLGVRGEYFPTQYLSLFSHVGFLIDPISDDDVMDGSISYTADSGKVSGLDVNLQADLWGSAGFTVWFK